MSFSRSSFVTVLGMVCHILCWSMFTQPGYADVPRENDLSLLRHDGEIFQECWIKNGVFADLLKDDLDSLQPEREEDIVLEAYSYRKKITKKVRFALHPKVFIKPFILVEELQNAFALYRTKKVQEGDQAPAMKELLANALTTVNQKSATTKSRKQNSSNTTRFLLSPYHNRQYGLHLEFLW